MRIEIFVVTTELNRNLTQNAFWSKLEALKADIIREYGGLTETGEERGYWSENGEILSDTVRRWIIITDKVEDSRVVTLFARDIKEITNQHSQLFTIDDKPFYV